MTTRKHQTKRTKPIAVALTLLVLSLSITIPSTLAQSVQTSNITYDSNGNRQSAFGLYFEYDEFNQLIRVRQDSSTGPVLEEYLYDENGERLMKWEPFINQTTYYISKEFITMINASGTFDYTYYWDGDTLVGRKDPDGKKYFYHPDHLGSTTFVTDEQGNVVEEITYEPFGFPIDPSTERFQYTGKELDPNTGLEYYGARYYDPKYGQFVQPDSNLPDPYDPQQLNRYAYARNNPYTYTDPDGNVINVAAAIGGALIGAGIGGIGSAVAQYVATGQVNWADAGKAAATGAAVGGVFGLTLGAGTALLGTSNAAVGASSFTAGALSGQAGIAAENVVSGDDLLSDLGNPSDIALHGGFGLGFGIGGKIIGNAVSKMAGSATKNSEIAKSAISITEKQLQKKFKHATAFGIKGLYNKENVAKFRAALEAFVKLKNTQAIPGTYRGTNPGIHYYNPSTNLWAFFNTKGEFVSGWTLGKSQIDDLLINRNVS